MKTSSRLIVTLLILISAQIYGQVAGPIDTYVQTPANIPGEAGPNQRLWQKVVSMTNSLGQMITRTNQAYIEVATGLNYWDPVVGQWMESKEEIESFPNGAAAIHGQHQVIFANNLNTSVAIDMQTPDGKRLQSHILGLSYFDTASGSNVWIAQITNCQGVILPPNQVLYRNAFTDFKADVLYSYTKSGFEQDIVLEERPPLPETFGLNSASSMLQVFTEFISPPAPNIKTVSVPSGDGNTMLDELLDFGVMKIGTGKAFILGQDQLDGIPVTKEWVTLEDRTVLIEQVPIAAVAGRLDQLPLHASIAPARKSAWKTASAKRVLPRPRLAAAHRGPMRLAQQSLPPNALVLDYLTLNTSQSNYTFQADSTYFISGTVSLNGTSTFVGGTVIKCATNGGFSLIPIVTTPQVNMQTAAYRPAIFTSKDDDSVGDTISTSTGNPTNYGAWSGVFSAAGGGMTLSNVRITYAKLAFNLGGTPLTLDHVQLLNCEQAVSAGGAGVTIRNALFSNIKTNFSLSGGVTIDAQNATFDRNMYLVTSPSYSSGCSAAFTNCIFANVTNISVGATTPVGDFNGSYNSASLGTTTFTNNTTPFQTAGAGNYYLANGSSFQNAGTPNIDMTLLADLKKRTTYPPLILTNTITINTILTPQAQRDTDTPDLGYHYDPLDYFVSCIVSNAAVTLANGVALAYNYSVWATGGFLLQSGSNFVSQGTAVQRNYIVHHSFVQEGPAPLWTAYYSYHAAQVNSMPISPYHSDTNLAPAITLRDTTIVVPAGSFYFMYSAGSNWKLSSLSVRDCEFYCGNTTAMFWNSSPYDFENNLFVYPSFDVENSGQVAVHNNLFIGDANSYAYFANSGSAIWTNQDNAYSGCDTYVDDTSNGTNGYNTYLNNAIIEDGLKTGDIVTNISWLAGPLGNYYQPTNSPLINKGSQTADLAGLYHYTVSTNLVSGLQIKETNSIVDISYHYVAVDANGNPIDTDGDGIPDYLEDANGNGLVNSGETDWQSATDLGLRVFITRPESNSVIP